MGVFAMDSPQPRLFTEFALTILNCLPFDPQARGRFEYLSGGLVWADEFPPHGSPEWTVIEPGYLYRHLLAYRASITLAQEYATSHELWEQVAEHAPNWPGLRPERRGEQAKRRLQAALRVQEKCFAELDR
jgi:hypothetical protein